MSDDLKGVVISHGTLSAALVEAVSRITGDADSLVAVSNDGCSQSTLAELVQRVVGDDTCLVFVDLPGGSCFHAAANMQHDHPSVAVVAGVNLAMLIDFVQHRGSDLATATARAAKVGGEAVRVIGA